jgi:hypothetical protein
VELYFLVVPSRVYKWSINLFTNEIPSTVKHATVFLYPYSYILKQTYFKVTPFRSHVSPDKHYNTLEVS